MEMKRTIIIRKVAIAAVVALTGCQELPSYLSNDAVLARAGGKELHQRDVQSVVPKKMSGADSMAFLDMYVERWVRKQLKLQEAGVLFSSSEADIDRMVEEYRQALLIRKLEQHYVNKGVDTTITEEAIAAYYKTHKNDFRLDRPMVKGRIVRFPEEYRQARRLKEAMASKSVADQHDFRDMCVKNNFTVTDFRERWTDFTEFLDYLPTLQSQSYNSVLASTAVQEMRDIRSHYFFQIDAVRREGDAAPIERLRTTIRRILLNQRQSEAIRRHEEELYREAIESGEAKIFKNHSTEKAED